MYVSETFDVMIFLHLRDLQVKITGPESREPALHAKAAAPSIPATQTSQPADNGAGFIGGRARGRASMVRSGRQGLALAVAQT